MGLFSSNGRGDKHPKPARSGQRTEGTSSSHEAGSQRSQAGPGAPASGQNEASFPGETSSETATGTGKGAFGSVERSQDMATIGQSIIFKGDLSGDEDLEIEGEVEGNIDLSNHQLTIGPNGKIRAEVRAKSIVVIGRVVGNLTATERIEVQATGVVEGDLRAPRLNIQEGAMLNGTIDMSSTDRATAPGPKGPVAAAVAEGDEAARQSA